MKIRVATLKDNDQLLPLIVEAERIQSGDLEKEKVNMAGLEREAHNDLNLWFKDGYQGYVLEDAGKLVGFTLAQTGDVIGKGWIYDLYVAPEYRKQGWGQKLLESADSWFMSKRVKRVRLEVHKDNQPALRLYKKHGYKEQPQIWLYYEKDI